MDTVDQHSPLRQAAQKRIKASHALGGDADCLTQYYREWADSYELDVDCECYRGPSIVAELAGAVQAAHIGRERAATAILDAGCGTGLVGIQLEHLGFRLIDGFDLSEAMAEMARETGVYRNVEDDIDLNRPLLNYSSASYDMTVCCGVFTLGHVHPHALRELARVTRPNGFVIASSCKSYAGAMPFEDEVMCLQEAGVLTPEQRLNDGRFLGEEDADYWTLRVLKKPAKQQQ
ncbi:MULTISPECIES: class I SAM-dependent DNA methyltransferase [Sinorhizobium]|uniref:class I SAM-dependent DNA methyltransferase n=1 Tax=Sinorhizobium TaxID=28105 RepID=UPI00041389F7|nr:MULTISPECIES: class I SAM-dependent methyltransferase [Sinorhizobium]WOS66928.1 class I SAM-dependent methyltransferase [Sinorhizobium fredii GR64]